VRIRIGIRAGLVTTTLVLLAFNAIGEESDGAAAARGEAIFTEFCMGCHGENKSGLINFSRSRDELQAILEGETDQMPDFYGIFSASEADDIYAYLTVPVTP
jgi:mono/diheme cytochrome c family protein